MGDGDCSLAWSTEGSDAVMILFKVLEEGVAKGGMVIIFPVKWSVARKW